MFAGVAVMRVIGVHIEQVSESRQICISLKHFNDKFDSRIVRPNDSTDKERLGHRGRVEL